VGIDRKRRLSVYAGVRGLLVPLSLSGMVYMGTYCVLVLAFRLLGNDETAAIKTSLYVWNRRSVQSVREAGLGE